MMVIFIGPASYKEDVDKLMNNPLWKKADMLLKISGPTIGEYVPNNLGADFNRGYGYFLERGHFIPVTTKEKQRQDCSGLMELVKGQPMFLIMSEFLQENLV